MIQEYIDLWFKNKAALENYFRQNPQNQYDEYKTILQKTIELVINPDSDKDLNTKRITQIDDGDYQGTLIFLIPLKTYQPNESEYVWTSVDYGSCSGCDTLLAISGYDDGLPSEGQVKEYMILSLHLVEKMKWLRGEE